MTQLFDRLWGSVATYVITTSTDDRPADGHRVGTDAASERRRRIGTGRASEPGDALRTLLEDLLAEYSGNEFVMEDRLLPLRPPCRDALLDAFAERVRAGELILWEVLRFPGRHDAYWRDVPMLSDLLRPAVGDVATTTPKPTWIDVGVVDQFSRPLPWLLPTLTLPSGRVAERRFDPKARTRVDEIPASGTCRLELRAPTREVAAPPSALGGPVGSLEGVSEPAWILIRVVDQFGRPCPSLRAELASPTTGLPAVDLDNDARARLQFIGGPQACTVQVHGRGSEMGKQP